MREDEITHAQMKVLVVDDMHDNVELICQILEDEFVVMSAYSGAECIEKALSEQPNLILLDVNMPKMDGYETMQKLQQDVRTRDIPVVFASAYFKEASMIVKGLELGAFDYLTKPIDEDILLAKVRVVKRIKLAEEMLGRSQKMDALGKLTGGIAHDYNNMLSVVLGYSQLLESALSDQPALAEFAQQIHRAGERGAKLTNKLLSFSRKDSGAADISDINALLKDEKLMLGKTLTARIKLNFNFSDDLWPVFLDASELIDVILNMSINAMHAMESGAGELTFKTRNEHINETDAKRLHWKEGDYVLLSIIDNGCGMDEATKEKIFDPFYSTKGEQGTGLGLSQVYGFVDRSGGIIEVYSELGHGTAFTLYFPRHDGNGNNKRLSNDVVFSNDLEGTETILIVDDEPGILSLTTEILSRQGYTTLCAENAKQALEMLEVNSVDLLLTDVIMLGMDGYQLASIVNDKFPDIKIQMASGFTDDRHINNLGSGELQQNLLHKPYNSQVLLKRVRDIFR